MGGQHFGVGVTRTVEMTFVPQRASADFEIHSSAHSTCTPVHTRPSSYFLQHAALLSLFFRSYLRSALFLYNAGKRLAPGRILLQPTSEPLQTIPRISLDSTPRALYPFVPFRSNLPNHATTTQCEGAVAFSYSSAQLRG